LSWERDVDDDDDITADVQSSLRHGRSLPPLLLLLLLVAGSSLAA